MAESLPSLGELETRVLQLVWREQPCTERRIWDLLHAERGAGRTTVLKTMQRLEAKGLLARVRGAGAARYRAVVARDRVLPALVRRFVQGTLGGSAAPLVAYLADATDLSAKDVAALRAIARRMAQGEAEKDSK